MRIVHWLFLVSVAMFISGIGFVVASGRAVREAPRSNPAPVAQPTKGVATVRQLMNGVINPTSKAVFTAVSTTYSAKGVEETFPRTDEEWNALQDSAAMLAEAGNLLMSGNRAVDKKDWMRLSQALTDTATVALKAAQAKDKQGVFDSGEGIYNACNECHQKYQRAS